MGKELLFEIGAEEIPASYVPPAIEQLRAAVEDGLSAARLQHGEVRTFMTPRRMAVGVADVADMQEDLEREVVGPPAKVAFDDEGVPTKAGLGFAKSQGVAVEDLEVRDTGKGEYVHVRVVDKGRSSFEVLPEILSAAAASLSFPKTMRWGPDQRFARPVRWLVALLGGDVLDMEFAGVKAGNETRGHRNWSPGPHRVRDVDDYLAVLESNYVLADPAARRVRILEETQRVAGECGGRLVVNESLLDEVTYLVEYPTVFAGRFADRFLELPRDVIVVAMKSHQRYFAVEDEDGKLLPNFLCVANVPAESHDAVREGNERVLVSRLDDAAFYWHEDTRANLEDKVESLKSVVWLEGLGSLYEKTERLERLARMIGERISSSETDTAVRAARLAKADLVTEMVKDGKEFTELQGVMGREYALASGENAPVAAAIHEHYMPRFAGDDLPSSEAGVILSIADRLDSIVGCFSAGLIPSGSQDPYALRRQAIGLIRILLERDLSVPVRGLAEAAADAFELTGDSKATTLDGVLDFVRQRARNVFMDEGYAYDLVDAVLAASSDDLPGARKRIVALSHFREADDFTGLVVGSRRVMNILKGSPAVRVDASALVEPASIALEKARAEAESSVDAAVASDDLDDAVRSLLGLRRPIDEFFDAVMVMVEDERLRAVRLGLLSEVRSLFMRIADFSRVVLEGEVQE